jgi:transcriptional regulator with XRE-family HTH domain
VGFGDLIRQRREALGLSQDDLADRMMQIAGRYTLTRQHIWRWEKAGVDPKFWLPTLAKALHLDLDQLRAMSANGATAPNAPSDESVHLYAARELITRAQWNEIISEAHKAILLYGMAEYRYAFDADVPSILSAATAAGCQVRVLLLDPGLPDITQIDQAEGNPAGTLSGRIRAALGRFQEIAETCGPRMQVRTYQTTPSVSIVRGDDRMFVTPYMHHLIGRSSPTHELRRAVDGGAFDRYVEHVDTAWTTAKEHTS